MNYQCPTCDLVVMVQQRQLKGIYVEVDVYCGTCCQAYRYYIRCERVYTTTEPKLKRRKVNMFHLLLGAIAVVVVVIVIAALGSLGLLAI